MNIKDYLKKSISGTAFEPAARNVLRKLRALSWPDRTEMINGKNFIIPNIKNINSGYSEHWMLPLLKKAFILRSGSFLDVGVNTGQTLLKVKSIEPERSYIGFEPNPSCIFYVEELIRVNNITDVTLVPVGIYVKNTILPLNRFIDSVTDSSASLISEFRPGAEVVSRALVPVFDIGTMDNLFAKRDFGVLKIDVEGAELEVLESLKSIVARDRPIIFMEILPAYNDENEIRISRQLKIQKLFQKMNYKILQVIISSDGSFVRLDKIDEIGVHSDLNKCEYIFAPQNHVSDLCA